MRGALRWSRDIVERAPSRATHPAPARGVASVYLSCNKSFPGKRPEEFARQAPPLLALGTSRRWHRSQSSPRWPNVRVAARTEGGRLDVPAPVETAPSPVLPREAPPRRAPGTCRSRSPPRWTTPVPRRGYLASGYRTSALAHLLPSLFARHTAALCPAPNSLRPARIITRRHCR